MYPLNRRRLRGDLIAVYTMFTGGLDLDPSLLEGLQSPIRRLRIKTAFSVYAYESFIFGTGAPLPSLSSLP